MKINRSMYGWITKFTYKKNDQKTFKYILDDDLFAILHKPVVFFLPPHKNFIKSLGIVLSCGTCLSYSSLEYRIYFSFFFIC